MCAFTTLHRTDYKYDKVHMYITTLRMWTLIHRLDNISILWHCTNVLVTLGARGWPVGLTLGPQSSHYSIYTTTLTYINRQREQAVSSQTNTGVDRCRRVTPHTAAALCVCITNKGLSVQLAWPVQTGRLVRVCMHRMCTNYGSNSDGCVHWSVWACDCLHYCVHVRVKVHGFACRCDN